VLGASRWLDFRPQVNTKPLATQIETFDDQFEPAPEKSSLLSILIVE
jgi:hypothetical protein